MFTPSARQRDGLARMEEFCGIRTPRTAFADAAEFSAYWTLVAARGDACKRSRTPEAAAKRAERITAHYQDEEALCRYGRAYLQRYQPSSGKLQQQLLAKSGDPDLSERVMATLAESINDAARIRELAEILQRQGRHAPAIRDKLRQRLFPTALIDACLRELTEAGDGTLLDAQALTRQVAKLRKKGLSQRAIQGRLMGAAGDRAAVTAAVQAHGDDAAALRDAYAKLARKPRTPQELTQRLLAKGFRYGDITALLAELKSSEA